MAAQPDRSPCPIVPKAVPHRVWEREEGLSSKRTQKSRWRILGGIIRDDIWGWRGGSSWRKDWEDPWGHNSRSLPVSKKKQRQWIGPTGLNQTGEQQLPGELGMGSGVPGDHFGVWAGCSPLDPGTRARDLASFGNVTHPGDAGLEQGLILPSCFPGWICSLQAAVPAPKSQSRFLFQCLSTAPALHRGLGDTEGTMTTPRLPRRAPSSLLTQVSAGSTSFPFLFHGCASNEPHPCSPQLWKQRAGVPMSRITPRTATTTCTLPAGCDSLPPKGADPTSHLGFGGHPSIPAPFQEHFPASSWEKRRLWGFFFKAIYRNLRGTGVQGALWDSGITSLYKPG